MIFAIQLENSSDLDSGRRPMPKFDEFFTWIAKVIEIPRCEVYNFLQSHDNFLGALPRSLKDFKLH